MKPVRQGKQSRVQGRGRARIATGDAGFEQVNEHVEPTFIRAVLDARKPRADFGCLIATPQPC